MFLRGAPFAWDWRRKWSRRPVAFCKLTKLQGRFFAFGNYSGLYFARIAMQSYGYGQVRR